MGLGLIAVFVIIIIVGLLLMRGGQKSKSQPEYTGGPARTTAPNRRDVVRDDRIHTSWGYTFPADYEFKPDEVRSHEQLLADFRKLLTSHFSDYKIYYQVPAGELDPKAHPACTPITFLFEKDGRYPLAVYVVTECNYRSMNMVGSTDVCYDAGIPYIRFFEEYANDDDYVVARIRYYLSQR